MFDVNSFSIAQALQESHDYKLVRSGNLLYLFPADANFEELARRDEYNVWLSKAVLVIDESGQVRKNRYGSTSEDW